MLSQCKTSTALQELRAHVNPKSQFNEQLQAGAPSARIAAPGEPTLLEAGRV